MKLVDVPIGMMLESKSGTKFIRIGPDEGFNMPVRKQILNIALLRELNFKRYVGYIPPELV